MTEVKLGPLAEKPVFSVLSTVYQAERFLARAIESVLAQDWPLDRLQYVLIDDGSSDGSAEILDRYAREFPIMQVVHQENRGLSGAIDRALSLLDGDLIRAVSGDDILAPGALTIAAEHLATRPHVGLLYTDMTIIGDDDQLLHPSFMRANQLKPHTGRPLGRLLQGNFVSGGAITLRGEMKQVVSPIPAHAAWEDYWWAWQVAHVADIDYLDVPTYLYRMHGTNLALGATGERLTFAQGEEIRFRRWMLQSIEPGEVDVYDLLTGFGQVANLTAQVMGATGKTPHEILTVTPDGNRLGEQAAQKALACIGEDDLQEAARFCVRALGHDPHRPDMQLLHTELTKVMFPPTTPAPAPAPATPIAAAAATRTLVVLADADELMANPALLQMYGQVVGPTTDATLVVHAVDWPAARIANDLGALLAQCDLDGDRAPDILAHAGPASDRHGLRANAQAVLTADPAGDHAAVGTGDLAQLRAAVTAAPVSV